MVESAERVFGLRKFNERGLKVNAAYAENGGKIVQFHRRKHAVELQENLFLVLSVGVNQLTSFDVDTDSRFSVTLLGKKFEGNFKEGMNDFRVTSYEEKLLAHVISVVRLHKLILYALKNDVRDAKDILDLIAVSHSNMNINATDFKVRKFCVY